MNAKEHNRIVKTTTIMVLIISIFSIMCLDSESWVPVIILAVCAIYFLLFFLANYTDSRIDKEGDIWNETNDKAA